LLFGEVVSWSQDPLLWCWPVSILHFVWMWWSRMPHGWIFFQGNASAFNCFCYNACGTKKLHLNAFTKTFKAHQKWQNKSVILILVDHQFSFLCRLLLL
jgi:hypothetical protein